MIILSMSIIFISTMMADPGTVHPAVYASPSSMKVESSTRYSTPRLIPHVDDKDIHYARYSV